MLAARAAAEVGSHHQKTRVRRGRLIENEFGPRRAVRKAAQVEQKPLAQTAAVDALEKLPPFGATSNGLIMPTHPGRTTPTRDKRQPYTSIRYTARLAQAGIEPSVGSAGDSYDNALAETNNGFYKAEIIHRRCWPAVQRLNWLPTEWVDWYNHRRLLELIGNIPPAEAEAHTINNCPSYPCRRNSQNGASDKLGAVQIEFGAVRWQSRQPDVLGHEIGRASCRERVSLVV